MKTKYFLIKLINVLLILLLLFVYQTVSLDRSAKESSALKEAPGQKSASEKAGSTSSPYKDGDYTGSADGYGGPVTMRVSIKDGVIAKIAKVSAPGEDTAYWDMAKALIPDIVASQDPNVDDVSGATYTSVGIKNAVTDALQKALKK